MDKFFTDFVLGETIYVNEGKGVFTDDPLDRGGQTYTGIARAHHPMWSGWPIIDAGEGDWEGLKDHVESFYYGLYVSMRLHLLPAHPLNATLFDVGVLFGKSRMVKWVQEGINMLKLSQLEVDGIIGTKTVAALLALSDPERMALRAYVIKMRVDHHVAVVTKTPSQRRFLTGWLARAARS